MQQYQAQPYKPYLDKFLPKSDPQYFELLNNKNVTVILQKKNFVKLSNFPSEANTELLNRVCIFSVTQMDPSSCQPTISPLRVGVINKAGVQLRHDFELNQDESE